jgi:hypothetical protein
VVKCTTGSRNTGKKPVIRDDNNNNNNNNNNNMNVVRKWVKIKEATYDTRNSSIGIFAVKVLLFSATIKIKRTAHEPNEKLNSIILQTRDLLMSLHISPRVWPKIRLSEDLFLFSSSLLCRNQAHTFKHDITLYYRNQRDIIYYP